MNEKDLVCFKHFLGAYHHQYKLNYYQRLMFDDNMEYYLGYRDSADYPLVYNMVFNKLLPRVQNVLARFMEQLYQGGTHNLVSVRPRKRSDTGRAPRVEGLLNFQLETMNDIDEAGGSFMFNLEWMGNALKWGNGIAKCYWRKEERITPIRMIVPQPIFDDYGRLVDMRQKEIVREVPQIIYDAPYAEVIPNKCFVPHPHYKSIQKMPNVFCVYKRSLDYVKKMADDGIFKNVDDIGWSQNNVPVSSGNVASSGLDAGEAFAKSLEIEGAYFEDRYDSDKVAPEIDIIEGYGRYIFPEDETPYEVGSGYKIKGKESEAIVHIGNYKTLLNIQKNKYHTRPFFNMSGYMHPELFWDIGIVQLGKGIQEQFNNLGNAMHQNAMLMINQMLMVREDSEIDPAALISRPGGIIPVEDTANPDVVPLATPDISQTRVFDTQKEFFEQTISEMTGEERYNMGAQPPRQEYVGTVYQLQQAGAARTKLLLMTMDYQGFRPLLKHFMRLNTYHLPLGMEARIVRNGDEDFEPLFSGDFHVDYDFSARYTAMEPSLGKHFRMQQLIQYAQMWMQNPTTSSYLQHHQFMKAILEMMDFADTDKYIYNPQQVAQMQQQNQRQMAQARLMEATIEDKLKGSEQQRDLTRDIIKGMIKNEGQEKIARLREKKV